MCVCVCSELLSPVTHTLFYLLSAIIWACSLSAVALRLSSTGPVYQCVSLCIQHTERGTIQASIKEIMKRQDPDKLKTQEINQLTCETFHSSVWIHTHFKTNALKWLRVWLFKNKCLNANANARLCVYVFSARSKSMVMGEVSRASCRPASPSLQEGALKAGWLKKQRSIMKNWQLRWFVLRSDQLYFYKDEEETKPQVTVPHQSMFGLKTSLERP